MSNSSQAALTWPSRHSSATYAANRSAHRLSVIAKCAKVVPEQVEEPPGVGPNEGWKPPRHILEAPVAKSPNLNRVRRATAAAEAAPKPAVAAYELTRTIPSKVPQRRNGALVDPSYELPTIGSSLGIEGVRDCVATTDVPAVRQVEKQVQVSVEAAVAEGSAPSVA